MTEQIKNQILAVRDTGLTNMFNSAAVQRIAYENGYFELVCYIEEHRTEYLRFILTGKREG
jgi:hypothetical protein